MWINDINEFEKEYNKWLENMDRIDNKKEKKTTTKAKKKIIE